MRYRHLLLAIGLCSISASASANSQNIDIAKPAAVICVGITTAPKNDGQFELICNIHEQEAHDARGASEPLPFATTDDTSYSAITGCNKPGDVVEQGFCLD